MNILMIISKNDKYGAQRVFLDYISILKNLEQNVIVITRGDKGYVTETCNSMGIHNYGIAMDSIKDVAWLSKLIKQKQIDIIHTSLDRADYFGIVASIVTKRPIVSTMNVLRYHIGYKFVDKVVTVSEKQIPILLKKGVNKNKIVNIYPGVDIKKFEKIDLKIQQSWKEKIEPQKYDIVFTHISSIIPTKLHEVSLKFVSILKNRKIKPLLIIVGDPLEGSYYNYLLKTIKSWDIKENVYFTGWTHNIPEILSFTNFSILPSENEAFGMVLLESIASGIPVIVNRNAGGAIFAEKYECGFMLDLNDLNTTVSEVLDSFKTNYYEILKQNCKNVAYTQFSLDQMGEKLLNLYRGIISSR